MANKDQIIEKAYEDFNARNIDAVLAVLSPDVDWANGMDGGYVHGHDAVREYWTRQWTMIDPHVTPIGFATEDDGRVTVEVHQIVRDMQGQMLADRRVEHIYTFDGDLVTNMTIRDI